MRSLGSISSELCEMQRLREKNIALGAKDAEWQRRISQGRTPPQHANVTMPNPAMLSPVRRPLSFDPSQFNANSFINRDARSYMDSPPSRIGMSPYSSYAGGQPTTGQINFSVPLPRADSVTQNVAGDTQLDRPVAEMIEPKDESIAVNISTSPAQQVLSTDAVNEIHAQFGHPRSPGGDSSTPSASTNAHSPEFEDPVKLKRGITKKPRSHTRGVGKIRRHRMTKEEEARFNPHDLVDLRGSTAAQSRKMTDQERDVMLHKRRLRNRQSAARSRDKQRKTIGDVGEEVDELLEKCEDVLSQCRKTAEEMASLQAANERMRRENEELKHENNDLKQTNTELKQASSVAQQSPMRRSGSMLRFSLSTDMLDKLDRIISGTSDVANPSAGESGSMYRIPSKLRLSLSTDKLADGFANASGALPPLSRDASILERLLDYGNNNNQNNNSSNNAESIDIITESRVKKE